MNTLKAEKRNMSTKAKKLRREGYVTGIVFGREMKESVPVKILKTDAERFLKTNGKGSQVLLEVDGTSMDVLVKEVDFNPLRGQVDEIDFQALVKGEKVHSVAEIHLLNHEKVASGVLEQLLHEVSYKAVPAAEIDFQALVKGEKVHSVAEIHLLNHEKVASGVLEQLLHEVSYKAVPAALVEKIEVNVGDMRVGDTIKVKDLDIASNKEIDLMTDLDAIVVTVSAVHNTDEEAADTEEK